MSAAREVEMTDLRYRELDEESEAGMTADDTNVRPAHLKKPSKWRLYAVIVIIALIIMGLPLFIYKQTLRTKCSWQDGIPSITHAFVAEGAAYTGLLVVASSVQYKVCQGGGRDEQLVATDYQSHVIYYSIPDDGQASRAYNCSPEFADTLPVIWEVVGGVDQRPLLFSWVDVRDKSYMVVFMVDPANPTQPALQFKHDSIPPQSDANVGIARFAEDRIYLTVEAVDDCSANPAARPVHFTRINSSQPLGAPLTPATSETIDVMLPAPPGNPNATVGLWSSVLSLGKLIVAVATRSTCDRSGVWEFSLCSLPTDGSGSVQCLPPPWDRDLIPMWMGPDGDAVLLNHSSASCLYYSPQAVPAKQPATEAWQLLACADRMRASTASATGVVVTDVALQSTFTYDLPYAPVPFDQCAPALPPTIKLSAAQLGDLNKTGSLPKDVFYVKSVNMRIWLLASQWLSRKLGSTGWLAIETKKQPTTPALTVLQCPLRADQLDHML